MRALENSMTIHVGYINSSPLSVDTKNDLIEVRKIMENEKIKIAIQGELGAYSHIAVEKLYQGAELKLVLHLKKLSNKLITTQRIEL